MNTKHRQRPTYINDPDYLRDLLTLTTKQMRAKWGVGRNAVYSHQRMSGSEIRQRIAEVEHG
ncbi:hypothetical protein ACQKFL_11660 [Vreelandella titanicae]|uniref:hypothetical protein n=1 Tax=Vreelandella titanicae TaxID=664683 RepID=UPI003CFF0E2E